MANFILVEDVKISSDIIINFEMVESISVSPTDPKLTNIYLKNGKIFNVKESVSEIFSFMMKY